MPTAKKKIDLFNSEEGERIRAALVSMERDGIYSTGDSYTADGATHPDHRIPFVEKHMLYLSKHSEINPSYYLSNLRLMLRIR